MCAGTCGVSLISFGFPATGRAEALTVNMRTCQGQPTVLRRQLGLATPPLIAGVGGGGADTHPGIVGGGGGGGADTHPGIVGRLIQQRK